LFPRVEVRDDVAGAEHEPEALPETKAPHVPAHDAQPLAYFFRLRAQLFFQAIEHRLRQIDGCDAHTGTQERQGNATAPGAKLKHLAALGEGFSHKELDVRAAPLNGGLIALGLEVIPEPSLVDVLTQ